jgi:uncharacterized protein
MTSGNCAADTELALTYAATIIRGDADEIAQLRREATELIAPCVVLIDRFWKARRQPPERKPKTGRNDPCPCGSGRKYKRCCGAN